jgi:hypothetical protein
MAKQVPSAPLPDAALVKGSTRRAMHCSRYHQARQHNTALIKWMITRLAARLGPSLLPTLAPIVMPGPTSCLWR